MSLILRTLFFGNIYLTISLILIALFAYVTWTRRRLYYLASKIPGPTGFPFVGIAPYYLNSEHIIANTLKFFDDFGDTVKLWIGPVLSVLVSRPQHLQIILTSPHCLGKDPRVYNQDPAFAGEGIVVVEPETWKLHRKLLNPAFNQRILNSYLDVFTEQTNILAKQLQNEVGKSEFKIYQYMDKCSLDIICETAMGTKVGAQSNPSEFFDVMPKLCALLMERVFRFWLYPEFTWLLSSRGRAFKKYLKIFHHYTKPVIESRRKKYFAAVEKKNNGEIIEFDEDDRPKRKLFIDILLEAEGKTFTLSELYQEVSTFISTGTDTVALVSAYTLLALAMHPEMQKKCAEELEDIFGQTDRDITLKDLQKLIYLEMCLKETMRYFTPVPFVARRVAKELDLGDYILPKGTTAFIAMVQLHRDPNIWPEPEKFIPDRFLPDESVKRHPYSFLPFSGGPRNCIGFRYGYMLSKIMVSTILRKYKVHTTMKREKMRFKHEIIAAPIGGINISIEHRY